MESLKKYMYLFIESTFPFLFLKICFNVSIFFQKLLNLLKKKLRVSFKGNKKDATEFLEVYHFN
ncbi:BnaC09g30640D [Brassica napus]|uniref:BnaC09g30640D protein n=1 Tax=Brassica napus TaxID=3708 RepID=A0A078FYR7_BRANA|nr:BnaC09g30640D [Brassica napus]